MRKTRSVSEYGLDGEQGFLVVYSKMIVRTFGVLALLLDLFYLFDHFWPFLAIFSLFLAIFGHF